VIRTLMERSALYRRALAPIMTLAGVSGTAAALAGWWFRLERPAVFVGYWLLVGIVTALAAFLLVRRQAFKQQEAFWSPPTRRVVQAIMPALSVGFVLGLAVLIVELKRPSDKELDLSWLPLAWIALYGCGVHAAGFFTPRGLRWFGLFFVAGGSAVFLAFAGLETHMSRPQQAGHLLMGLFFGILHLAYGTYLSVTEKGKNAA
jgi:hypothetical protein